MIKPWNNVYTGQGKTQLRLPSAIKFCSWVSKNRSSVTWWASEISFGSLVSLTKNVSLINDKFSILGQLGSHGNNDRPAKPLNGSCMAFYEKKGNLFYQNK